MLKEINLKLEELFSSENDACLIYELVLKENLLKQQEIKRNQNYNFDFFLNDICYEDCYFIIFNKI